MALGDKFNELKDQHGDKANDAIDNAQDQHGDKLGDHKDKVNDAVDGAQDKFLGGDKGADNDKK